MVTLTQNKSLTYPANGADVDTWDSLCLNPNWNAIDNALGGTASLNATAQSGIVALSSTQYTPPNLEISGTLGAAVNYQFPSGVGWIGSVANATTGAFAITISSGGGGTSVVVPQGYSVAIVCDGTNVRFQQNVPGTVAGTNGEVLYNASGSVAGAVAITTDGTDLTVGGNLAVTGNLSLTGQIEEDVTINGGAQTPPIAVAFSATAMVVNCALSNVFATVLAGNVTTAPTLPNIADGQTINWFLTQDATGSRTMTWPVAFKWPGGTAGVLSTAANSVDLLVATYRAATGNFYCSLLKAFA
jgi:hypothetical protein